MRPPAAAQPWTLNTSNPGKVADYRRLMGAHGLVLAGISGRDLPEIDADPESVVVHKASQFAADHVLVDDGSLEVAGVDIGVHIRWRLAALASLVGRPATMRVLVGFRAEGQICLCEGAVDGHLVAPRGQAPPSFTVLPYFQPLGRHETLAERRDDAVNPRALAVARLARMELAGRRPPILTWDGPWQKCSRG